MAHRDRYRSCGELAAAHQEGVGFRVHAVHRGSGIAIVAPHGGRIERGTSEIARAIAGEDFDPYLFEACLPARNFEILHLTSHHFDQPRCLSMISGCHAVIALGHDVGLTVRAEGVEIPARFDFLKACDCDACLGYLFSKLLTAEEFERRLRVPPRSAGGSAAAAERGGEIA